MNMRQAAIALLLLAGCGRPDPPPPASHPRPSATPAPTTDAKISKPAVASTPGLDAKAAKPAVASTPGLDAKAAKPAESAAPAPPPATSEPARPLGGWYSPVFTFTALDGAAELFLNGRRAGVTPYLWAFSERTDWEPSARPAAWPPSEAVLASRGTWLHNEGLWGHYELWISAGAAPDEHLLHARAEVGLVRVQGSLRVRLPGRRFVLHRPPHVNEESPEFSRWNRTLCFDAR